jgi:hypothetical protein
LKLVVCSTVRRAASKLTCHLVVPNTSLDQGQYGQRATADVTILVAISASTKVDWVRGVSVLITPMRPVFNLQVKLGV